MTVNVFPQAARIYLLHNKKKSSLTHYKMLASRPTEKSKNARLTPKEQNKTKTRKCQDEQHKSTSVLLLKSKWRAPTELLL
jgi:hypothetical protein